MTCPVGKDALAGGPNRGVVGLDELHEEKDVKHVAGARVRAAARLGLRKRMNLLRDLRRNREAWHRAGRCETELCECDRPASPPRGFTACRGSLIVWERD